MASSLAGGEELLRLNPTFLLYSEPTTPLQHSHTATDKRLAAADVIGWLGPGGNFLTEDHTLSHFREMWEPSLFERRRVEEWIAGAAFRRDPAGAARDPFSLPLTWRGTVRSFPQDPPEEPA